MDSKNGSLVISLDFELLWGVRDKKTIASYGQDIENVKYVIPRLLKVFADYDVKATFSTVGFLFAHNKEELLTYVPQEKPTYINKNLSPYNGHFDLLEESSLTDPYHYAPELITQIKSDQRHSLGTHTFSHYYCLESGQTLDQFKADIVSAKRIAENNGIQLQSIVFPRNQCNIDYLNVCQELGIASYRGNEKSWAFEGNRNKTGRLWMYGRRLGRGLDAYFNIFGHHCYTWDELRFKDPIYNLPSSRLLRSYSKKLGFLEFLKIRRIKKSMKHAAKHNKVFHLWWHPHNFGSNMDQNFKNLEKILTMYQALNKKYGFMSHSMESLVEKLEKDGRDQYT
ncbi:MAG: polysaccharide deacetylase family protein [Flavobacteriaceae bacterium]|jgi:peptidoglycan/xylan/chitin deacetylase (PgdA/CDA1 family)|uniref:polysaccharide deacetylase family protein n=1 Tax=Flagellimonas TaxID=444459 RepID=UPI000E2438AD|nr:polysaccharide deacetylase family protein [Allomuricauda sp.]MCR9263395.1 polysaccharide deacetylase family protein [Flavobacteriaceae bacterium]